MQLVLEDSDKQLIYSFRFEGLLVYTYTEGESLGLHAAGTLCKEKHWSTSWTTKHLIHYFYVLCW